MQAVAEINAALARNAPPGNATAPRSLSELMALTRTHVTASFEDQWKSLGESESHAMRSFEIVALSSMLDSFGYWPDDSKTYKKGSRFPDSRHTFNASYFDILVSNDKRMRNRAQAVYNILGIQTQVMSAGEFCQGVKGP